MPITTQPYIVRSKRLLGMFRQLNVYYRFKCFMGNPHHRQPRNDLTHIPFSALYSKTAWKGSCWLYTLSKYPTAYLRAAMHAATRGWASSCVIVRPMLNCGWFYDLALPAKVKPILGTLRDLNGEKIRTPLLLITYAPGNLTHLDPMKYGFNPEDPIPKDERPPPDPRRPEPRKVYKPKKRRREYPLIQLDTPPLSSSSDDSYDFGFDTLDAESLLE